MSNRNADSTTELKGPAADKPAEQAYWPIPGSSARVVYSLPLFHDIDFAVNEGYRKIPHGGIEVGALLFGSVGPSGVTIEAFRPIECEHVFGPSFLLSDRDLNALEAQIKNAPADPELHGLTVVGWFLAHTRGPLQMTDPEFEVFERFFPQPNQLTLLVKPERFKPTLFGFLPRDANGTVGRDASQNAIILPLPGRANRSAAGSEPIPSLMAPKTSRPPVSTPRASIDPPMTEPQQQAEMEPVLAQSPLSGTSSDGPASEATVTDQPPASVPEEATMAADIRAARRRLKFEEARLLAQGQEESSGNRPHPPTDALSSEPGEEAGPSAPTPTRKPPPVAWDAEVPENPYHALEDLAAHRPPAHSSKLMLVLPLAALFGSIVGYVAYLQIPSPIIPVKASSLDQFVLVSWPPEETSKAVYAAIRVDDHAPVPLSASAKAIGHLELPSEPDMKIELIAHNWLRNSRGIVRFVKPEGSKLPVVEP